MKFFARCCPVPGANCDYVDGWLFQHFAENLIQGGIGSPIRVGVALPNKQNGVRLTHPVMTTWSDKAEHSGTPSVRSVWLDPENPGENFFTRDQWEALRHAFDLSERELAVTILLVAGYSREEIAVRLPKADGSSISTDTLRVYIERIFAKGRVHDRLGLVLRLVRAFRDIYRTG